MRLFKVSTTMLKGESVMSRLFASGGSCLNPIKIIKGRVEGITFISNEFTGTMNSQKFWNDLKDYANNINAYVELRY